MRESTHIYLFLSLPIYRVSEGKKGKNQGRIQAEVYGFRYLAWLKLLNELELGLGLPFS
jgi:hypothetical protein